MAGQLSFVHCHKNIFFIYICQIRANADFRGHLADRLRLLSCLLCLCPQQHRGGWRVSRVSLPTLQRWPGHPVPETVPALNSLPNLHKATYSSGLGLHGFLQMIY